MKHVVIKELAGREMVAGVTMREVHLDRVMVTFVDLEQGAVVPPHSHPHDQITLVISGSLLYNVGGEEKMCKEGEVVLIPGGVEHSVAAVTGPVLAYDCFGPIREDYVSS